MSNKIEKSFTIRKIIDQFSKLVQVIDGEKNIDNIVTVPGFYRAGLELSGSYIYKTYKNKSPIWFGNQELKYLKGFSKEIVKKRILNIIKLRPPAIFTSRSVKDHNFLISLNKDSQIPIVKTILTSNEANLSIYSYISESLLEYKLYHGTLVEIYGEGVLLTGQSGIGKSEIALELLRSNHIFIADDAIEIASFGKSLKGRGTNYLGDFIEIRGLGILNVEKMFGIEKKKSSTNIALVIELFENDKKNSNSVPDRIGLKQKYKMIENIKLPLYQLPVTPGRKMSELIISAVIDYKLKRKGYFSGKEYLDKYGLSLRNKKNLKKWK